MSGRSGQVRRLKYSLKNTNTLILNYFLLVDFMPLSNAGWSYHIFRTGGFVHCPKRPCMNITQHSEQRKYSPYCGYDALNRACLKAKTILLLCKVSILICIFIPTNSPEYVTFYRATISLSSSSLNSIGLCYAISGLAFVMSTSLFKSCMDPPSSPKYSVVQKQPQHSSDS